MAFPLEKILTVSLGDYVENFAQRRLPEKLPYAHYKLVGVHVEVESGSLIEAFREKIPKEAEVVVDYKLWNKYAASGTALVPI